MNRLAIVYVIVLTTIIMLLTPGCATGVSQEEFDKVSSDLASVRDQLSTLRSAYDKTKSDFTEAQTQRSALQNDYNKTSGDLSAALAEIDALENHLLTLYGTLPTTTVEVTQDIEYGRADDIPLLLDIYIPETPIASPMPAVIWIHGGGWRGGDKGSDYWFNSLATHGFFVVSINYRLSGVAPFPAAVEDSKCAVRWLRANAEMYNVDPQRIGVAGGSAGGHLAMMVGLVDETAGLEGNGGWEEFSSRVQAACSYYGISDFVGWNGEVLDAAVKFLSGTLDEKPEIYKAASPINYVTADDPPLLLVHGKLDPLVPYTQSEIIYQAYQQAGLEAELINVSAAGHGFRQLTDSPISPSLDEIEQVRLDFFIKHLVLNR